MAISPSLWLIRYVLIDKPLLPIDHQLGNECTMHQEVVFKLSWEVLRTILHVKVRVKLAFVAGLSFDIVDRIAFVAGLSFDILARIHGLPKAFCPYKVASEGQVDLWTAWFTQTLMSLVLSQHHIYLVCTHWCRSNHAC